MCGSAVFFFSCTSADDVSLFCESLPLVPILVSDLSSFRGDAHRNPLTKFKEAISSAVTSLISLYLIYFLLGNLPIERAKDAVCFLQRCGVSLM